MRVAGLPIVCAGVMAAVCLWRLMPRAAVHDRLEKLSQDITFTSARLYPMQATALGIAGHDSELEAPSEAFRAAEVSRLKAWQQQLQAIAATFTPGSALV